LLVDTVLAIASRFRCVQACLNQVLSFSLGDKGLKLRCCECVDQTGFGDDEQEDLSSRKDGQFVRLLHDTGLPLGECDMATRLVSDELDLDLSSLTSGLIIIVVVVVRRRGSLAFDAASTVASN